MDHRLDESLGLDDGGIGIEFDGEQEVVTTSDCSFDTSTVHIGNDEDMELGQIKDDHPMETDYGIIGGIQYSQAQPCQDMQILGGEEEVLIDNTQQIQINMDTETVVQNPVPEIKKNISFDTITPKVSRVNNSAQPTYSLQTFRIGNSSLKPVSIAPKPITMSSGFTNVKKISLSGVQPRPGIMAGTEVPGRQVVVVPGGTTRLKMVGAPVAGNLRAAAPVQLQLRQRMAPPLTKLTLAPGSEAPGIVTMQKATPTRYISIQQAQQMGLLAGGKITQLVMSPTKQPVATSTPLVRPVRQNFNTIKSPTKILPAPQGVSSGNKVLLAPGPQSIVMRPTTNKPTQQILKMDSGSSGTILASLPAGQKINPQQIHQINIPGKGVQYVRLVPAAGLSGPVRPVTPSPAVTPVPAMIAASPVAPAPVATTATVLAPALVPTAPPTPVAAPIQNIAPASPLKPIRPSTQQILPKTFLIADFQNNLVQVVPNKGQSVINTSNANTSMKKFVGKQAKLVPISINMTTAPQKQSLPSPIFTVATSKVEQVIKTETALKTEPIVQCYVASPEPEPERTIFVEENVKFERSGNEVEMTEIENIQEQMTSSNEIPMQEEIMQEETDEDMLGSPAPDSPVQSMVLPTQKHIVMLPASYLQQIQPSNQHNNTNKTMAYTKPNIEIKEEVPDYNSKIESALEFGLRPRKPCNCTKSQCLKLYCDCFANGEFCNQCNCNNCFNNLENEEYRQKAIRSCLERNPNAFRPKIGKAKNNMGPDVIRRHNKGCNCKRSGCLKNYCECYEGKIACSANCKCIGCRNIEDSMDKKMLRRSRTESVIGIGSDAISDQNNVHGSILNISSSQTSYKVQNVSTPSKQPCSIMTSDVIEAVCQCLIAQAADAESLGLGAGNGNGSGGAARQVLEEFAHCLKDIINAAQHTKHSAQQKSTASMV